MVRFHSSSINDASTVHNDAAIVIEADRIAANAPTAELLAHYPTTERIDGRGKAVMPASPTPTRIWA